VLNSVWVSHELHKRPGRVSADPIGVTH
jgi:hypothetical protein